MLHGRMTHEKCIRPTSENHRPEDSGAKIITPEFIGVVWLKNLCNIMNMKLLQTDILLNLCYIEPEKKIQNIRVSRVGSHTRGDEKITEKKSSLREIKKFQMEQKNLFHLKLHE